MTNNSPLPNNQSGLEPNDVNPIDQMLSALADAELGSDELIELEEFAVDNDQTLDQLGAPFHATKAQLSDLLNEPAPPDLRRSQVLAALDAMDEPEVVSLAAARATRADELKRSATLNRRLRQLSAVAAGFVVIAGISLVALQGGIGGGSDDASLETAAIDDGATATTEAASGAAESAAEAEEADAAMMSDEAEGESMAVSDDAMEEEDDAMEEAAPAFSLSDPLFLTTPIPVQDLTLEELRDEQDLDTAEPELRSIEQAVQESICLDQAIDSGVDPEEIQQILTVEQDGTLYEVFVVTTDELRVFQLADCVEID